MCSIGYPGVKAVNPEKQTEMLQQKTNSEPTKSRSSAFKLFSGLPNAMKGMQIPSGLMIYYPRANILSSAYSLDIIIIIHIVLFCNNHN